MDMNIVCLDLEGVLVPEIWVAFAEKYIQTFTEVRLDWKFNSVT